MIDAEYEEIEMSGDELDLSESDSLPWLESDDDDDQAGGIDPSQVMIFVAALLVILIAIVGLVWILSRDTNDVVIEPDGSTIAAPEGPIKERPEDAGGRGFAGADDVAPVVGEGETRDLRMADQPPAPQDNSATASDPAAGAADPVSEPTPPESPTATPAATSGVGVQLAAYRSRERAQRGWNDLRRQTEALDGVNYRVVQARVDIGTVYRLQAVAPTRAAADELCAAIKRDGLDCQVIP